MKVKWMEAVVFALFLVAAFSGAVKAQAAKPAASGKAKVDVCALLTSADIQAVQGEAFQEAKFTTQPGGGMLISQCFFRTATFAKSVTLSLAAPDPANPSALTPRKFWQKQFHSGPDGKSSKKSDPESEEKMENALPVSGIGKEAYWTVNPMTGALYVLQGDFYLRISVGGVPDLAARKDKATVLARAALKHLPAAKH